MAAAPPTPRATSLPRRLRTVTKGNLGSLFVLERRLRAAESAPGSPRRRDGRVRRPEAKEEHQSSDEEGWRFQAEFLRAECNFLRMERDLAFRKLDRCRAQSEAALISATEKLASGRKKFEMQGRSDSAITVVLDAEIGDLQSVLEDLRRSREEEDDGGSNRRSSRRSFRDLYRCRRGRNFNRQASTIRRQLEKMAEDSAKEICEITVAINEPEKKGSGSSGGRGGHSGMEVAEKSQHCKDQSSRKWPQQQHQQHQQQKIEASAERDGGAVGCCCECQKAVARIVDQVSAEAEQWSEMQGMLERVQSEMNELQVSRDIWRCRAVAADVDLESLHAQMVEWKYRAEASESNVEALRREVSALREKLHGRRGEVLTETCEPATGEPPELEAKAKDDLGRVRAPPRNSPRKMVSLSKRLPLQDVENFMELRRRR